MADADIFCANKILLTDKPLMKTESLVSQKSSSKPSSTADTEIFNLHGLLLPQKPLTKTRSLRPKNHPKSLVLRLTLTSTTHKDYSWQKRGHETESLLSQNSSSKRNSTADADIFNVHRLLLPQKPLTKIRTLGPQKSSMKPNSTADADIYYAQRLLLTEKWSRNWVPTVPKFILETQFYGWGWHLQSTQTTAASETVDEN
jgi:hypothetical protein